MEPTAAAVVPNEAITPTPFPVIGGWQEDPSIPWWWTTDTDPSTVWSGTVIDANDETEFGLDLGSIQPVNHLRWEPTWPMQGTLEIRLSIDGVTWYRLTVLTMNQLVPDQGQDIPVTAQARYIAFIYTGAGGSVGAIREIEVWLDPSGYARTLDALPLVTPEPVPTEPVVVPTEPPPPTEPPVIPTAEPVIIPTPEPTLIPTEPPLPTEPPVIPTEEPTVEPQPVPTPEPPPEPTVTEPPPAVDPTPEGG